MNCPKKIDIVPNISYNLTEETNVRNGVKSLKKENIINLIRYHAEQNDIAFNREVQIIAREFDKIGDTALAQHIMALVSNYNVFVPQEITTPEEKLLVKEYIQMYDQKEELEFFSLVSLNSEPLHLPEIIMGDIEGIINTILNQRQVNKFLFAGQPGTGKTETVKQIARLLKRPLYSVNFELIIDSKLGQSGKNIVALFDEMNRLASKSQAVFLFDEIDILALDRLNSNDLREMGRATSFIMKELDKLLPKVKLFATTNLHKSLDKALLRRFDAVISFDRYNQADLLEISEKLLLQVAELNHVTVKNHSLFNKVIQLINPIPNPGELKNMINLAVAFSDERVEDDYLRRLFKHIVPDDEVNFKELSDKGFSIRELESLTDVSKSQIAREIRSVLGE